MSKAESAAFPDFLHEDPVTVARKLLGCELLRDMPDGRRLRLRIVETEAYHQSDEASHSFRGQTPRTKVMFGPSGHLYVYFTYGMHYCCNVVTGGIGEGSAVLIRAVEPVNEVKSASVKNAIQGHSTPRPRGLYTHGSRSEIMTNGPAILCRALGIDRTLNGHDLHDPPLRLLCGEPIPEEQIVQATRIGISRAQDARWRFYLQGNPYVSKK